jgi:hypothetical protein
MNPQKWLNSVTVTTLISTPVSIRKTIAEQMKRRLIIGVLIISTICGCSLDDAGSPGLYIYSDVYNFNEGQQGWVADFADYPAGPTDSVGCELAFSYTDLPQNLGNRKAIMMSGTNYDNNLFMFMKKKVIGLAPETFYTVVFEVELASNAPTQNVGTDSGPGSVYLKAGAVSTEPKKVIDGSNYVMNVDKGYESQGGSDLVVLGNIGVAPNTTQYTLITRSNEMSNTPFIVRSNSAGELWLVIGTDSGFEGTTTLYYTRVGVVFTSSD